MKRTGTWLVGALVALMLVAAGCGGGGGGVSASKAQKALEDATHLTLTEFSTGSTAQGTVYSNQSTVATDKQLLFVAVAKHKSDVDKAKKELTASTSQFPSGTKTYVHDNVIVVYVTLPGGTDQSSAVKKAVDGL